MGLLYESLPQCAHKVSANPLQKISERDAKNTRIPTQPDQQQQKIKQNRIRGDKGPPCPEGKQGTGIQKYKNTKNK